MVVDTMPKVNGMPVKERLGPFPTIEKVKTHKNNKKGNSTKSSRIQVDNKLAAAKKRPVKPVFTIHNENNVDLEGVWKIVTKVISNPKLYGFKKLSTGSFVVTSTDEPNIPAIRNVKDGLVKDVHTGCYS